MISSMVNSPERVGFSSHSKVSSYYAIDHRAKAQLKVSLLLDWCLQQHQPMSSGSRGCCRKKLKVNEIILCVQFLVIYTDFLDINGALLSYKPDKI